MLLDLLQLYIRFLGRVGNLDLLPYLSFNMINLVLD